MPISTIGAYKIEESASEATTSSIHTAPDYPSSLLIISCASPYSPLWPVMDSGKRLQSIEEELTANQIKTDASKLTLKTIMNKLEVPVPEESVREEEFNFGQNSGIPVNSRTHILGHVKIKLATPVDFNRDHKNVGNSSGAERGMKEKQMFGLSRMVAFCKRMANYK